MPDITPDIAQTTPVKYENRYCPTEKSSTKHKIRIRDGQKEYVCMVCGSVKSGIQAPKWAWRARLGEELNRIFMLEASDKPIKYDPDSQNKKSAAGAHRFDNGIKYKQLKLVNQFKNIDVKHSYTP